LSTLELNQEGSLFSLKLKKDEVEGEIDDLENEGGTIIRIRGSEVYFGDEKRIILQISDLTDSINLK
jgi:hypothetical protein